jgi:hypothetical protein
MKAVRALCGNGEVPRWAVAALAVFLAIVTVGAVHAGVVGVGQGGDDFTLNFDENGNGMVSINGAPFTPLPGQLLPDPSQAGNPPALTYILPAGQVPVFNGDGGILETPLSTSLSDGVRFTDGNGNLSGATADRMIYYSDTTDGATDLADTGIPANFVSSFTVIEVGPEGNNGFSFGSANVYHGISDIPEPSTLILGGLGLMTLLLFGRRRGALKKV